MSRTDDHSSSAGRRVAVLSALKAAAGPQSINDLAEKLGVHANTVRFHLTRLVAAGQVEQVISTLGAPGRPAQLFAPTPGMDPYGPRAYRMLAEVLVAGVAEGLDPGRRALNIGRSWGQRQAQSRPRVPDGSPTTSDNSIDQLVGLLEEIGFAPERDEAEEASSIKLRHCPFLELTHTQSAVVCPLHLGLMQGALQAWGASVQVDRLDPFVEPDLCLAHLSTQGAS